MTDDAKRLWEVDHPYYFDNEPEGSAPFESWNDFLFEYGEGDMDYNLVFRWDWREGSDWGAGTYNGDDYYRHAVLTVGFILQRKARCFSRDVKVCRADEPAIRVWLEQRYRYMLSMWEPFGV